jgi:hypothetical protein
MSVLCVIGNTDSHYDCYTNGDGPYKDSIRYNDTTRNLVVFWFDMDSRTTGIKLGGFVNVVINWATEECN